MCVIPGLRQISTHFLRSLNVYPISRSLLIKHCLEIVCATSFDFIRNIETNISIPLHRQRGLYLPVMLAEKIFKFPNLKQFRKKSLKAIVDCIQKLCVGFPLGHNLKRRALSHPILRPLILSDNPKQMSLNGNGGGGHKSVGVKFVVYTQASGVRRCSLCIQSSAVNTLTRTFFTYFLTKTAKKHIVPKFLPL